MCYAFRVRIPLWLMLAFAALVVVYGAYRIKLGLSRTYQQGSGLRAMSQRTHLVVGIVYVLLAAGLAAVSFGWNPWSSADQPAPAKPKPKS